MEQVPLIADLVEQFRRLQGVGAKSANRLAFQILAWNPEDIDRFGQTLQRVAKEISFCPQCFNFSVGESLCGICQNHKRDSKTICVVSSVRDLAAIERTNEYTGQYHVLHGLLSPLEGISPEDLKIKELIRRVEKQPDLQEIILAITPSTEGEATSLYMSRLLKPLVSKVSRLAFGLSVGCELEQTDELTLSKALEGRHDLL